MLRHMAATALTCTLPLAALVIWSGDVGAQRGDGGQVVSDPTSFPRGVLGPPVQVWQDAGASTADRTHPGVLGPPVQVWQDAGASIADRTHPGVLGPPVQVGGGQPGNGPADQGVQLDATRVCRDTIQVAPILVFSSAGTTMLGPEMSSITVYTNGLVLLASAADFAKTTSARMVMVEPDVVQRFAQELIQRNAHLLCDQETVAFDLPLKTVTILSGETDAGAHTYSYWIGSGAHGTVEDAIEQFVIDQVMTQIPE